MASVTVIIPNYNHAKYLKQRIESVLNQTYPNFDVILLDDCSLDNSKEIIENYKIHPKVSSIVVNQVNSGSVFRQWKRGIELATGDYVWIAESDDFADHLFLERMVPHLDRDRDIGFIYCNGVVLNDVEEVITTFADLRNESHHNAKWSDSYVNEGLREIQENLMMGCTVNNASGVLFRRSALLDVKPFDRELKYVGDWYCYLKLCSKYKMGYVNEQLNFYREHQNNASRNLKKNLQFVSEYFQIFDWASKNLPSLTKKELRTYFSWYTSHSLIFGFRHNWRVYKKLARQNASLFSFMMTHNLKKHKQSIFNRIKSSVTA
ncbi:MAG: glycosyltransferase [Chitinophagaceae bacterium]|nr:MAG: glycosyltransferase [Chitinophagaceae bacterium]